MPSKKLAAKRPTTSVVPPDSQAMSGRLLGETCACATSGQAIAPPSRMKSRRRIGPPEQTPHRYLKPSTLRRGGERKRANLGSSHCDPMSANRMVRPPNGANARVDVRVGSNSEFGTLSRGVRFTPVADIVRLSRHVRKVPEGDASTAANCKTIRSPHRRGRLRNVWCRSRILSSGENIDEVESYSRRQVARAAPMLTLTNRFSYCGAT